MDSHFIDDGQNFDGYVKESPGLHGAATFTYRPMTVSDIAAWNVKVASLKGKDLPLATAKEMAARIGTWDLDKPKDADNVARLSPVLFYRIWGIITQSEPSDTAPDGTEADKLNQKNS